VLRFREKPDLKTARRFVAAGNFYWNAGMFFWRTSVLLEELRRHRPQMATVLASLPSFASRNFKVRLRDTFPLCENISIDYAVLEPAKGVVGIAADDIGWNDVGSWDAVYDLMARDASGNASHGETLLHDSNGNFVHAGGRLVALLGVKDLVIVDTPDALLIADRHRAQEVGALVKLLEKAGRDDLL
jgi:mannose-1-phosphate guanylyltransferase